MLTDYINYIGNSGHIRSHTIPVPLYDFGNKILYKDGEDKDCEAVIEGYSVYVYPYEGKDGKKELGATITYDLDNKDNVYEECIIGLANG